MALGTEVKPDSRGLVVIVPAGIHRELKFAALEEDTSLQRLVLGLIEAYLEERKQAFAAAVK